MNIITKFTVVTQQGMAALSMLTHELAREKFTTLLTEKVLNDYLSKNFNEQTLIADVNSISNEWLVVYVEGQPAGYARLTSKGQRPSALVGKRAIRMADFGVLHRYPAPVVKEVLLEKCLAASKAYENIWITEYADNPLVPLFESKGFTRQDTGGQLDELPLASVCLIA